MRWRYYWLLWRALAVIDRTCQIVGKWSMLAACKYASSCYVTGGPKSCMAFLDKTIAEVKSLRQQSGT